MAGAGWGPVIPGPDRESRFCPNAGRSAYPEVRRTGAGFHRTSIGADMICQRVGHGSCTWVKGSTETRNAAPALQDRHLGALDLPHSTGT